MTLRERKTNREHERPRQHPSTVIPESNIERDREAADRLLEAGDDAINRALSANSEDFLAANTQEGGQ